MDNKTLEEFIETNLSNQQNKSNQSINNLTITEKITEMKNHVCDYLNDQITKYDKRLVTTCVINLCFLIAILLKVDIIFYSMYLMMLSNMIASIRYTHSLESMKTNLENLDNSDKLKIYDSFNVESQSVITNWTTYGTMIMFFNMLDFMSYMFEYQFINFTFEIVKICVFYKVMSDILFSEKVIASVKNIYVTNKIGFEYVCNTCGEIRMRLIDHVNFNNQLLTNKFNENDRYNELYLSCKKYLDEKIGPIIKIFN